MAASGLGPLACRVCFYRRLSRLKGHAMKVYRLHEFKGADGLRLESLPDPTPATVKS